MQTLARSDGVVRRRRDVRLPRSSVEREPLRNEAPRVGDGAAAIEPELLLLACCAAQIAAEAGTGSVVHAAEAPRQGTLLSDALVAAARAATPAANDCVTPIAAIRPGAHRRGRPIVYLPANVVAAAGLGQVDALLRRATAQHGEDALAVLAVEAANSHSAAPHAAAPCTIGPEIARIRGTARQAGWEVCQLWTDGMARHALAVLERRVTGALLGACMHGMAQHVTET